MHEAVLRRVAKELTAAELNASAIVFAPHPDDETLGCGGTIIRKRAAGAEVRVVFVTDGGASHAEELIARADLRALREREAIAATQLLGVEPPGVVMLGLPDGELASQFDEGVTRVRRLLEEHGPEQLYVPYRTGEHMDHKACAAIVFQAVRQSGWKGAIFEYPVWLWRHWPTVPLGRTRSEIRAVLGATWRAWFGLRLLTHFRASVEVSQATARKQEALACHVSQMERRDGDSRWGTLLDVADGEFVPLLLRRDREYYHRVDV